MLVIGRSTTLLVPVVAVIVLQTSPALADCMASRPFIVPVPGTALPPDPVIYAFVPEHMADPGARIESDDGEASVTIERVSGNETFNAFRLDVKKKAPGSFEVVVSMKVGKSENVYAESSFTIDPAWKPPTDEVVKIDELTKESEAWECSHNMTYNLHPSVQAMAYRLEWSKTQEDFASGKRESAVFPYSLGPFFQKKPEPAPAVIKLGHANCLSNTFRWPSAYVYAGLVALHPDGSETPAGEAPAEVPWGFESAIFGAMTEEFYEEVHGKTEETPPPAAAPEKPGGCSQGGGAPVMLAVFLALCGMQPLRRRQG
jgi:hypothetical protein